MTTSEIATVLAWHDALNAGDVETLVSLSSDDIDIGDAHGAVQGHEALRRWAGSVMVAAELGQMYVHDGVVVVEQEITGRDDPGPSRPPRRHSVWYGTMSPRSFVMTTWRRR
ncbi:snoaL-like domain protein [Mycobacterium kansasii 824]|nr:snoaL-like domain protein [Mycobacterium kansasii 824]